MLHIVCLRVGKNFIFTQAPNTTVGSFFFLFLKKKSGARLVFADGAASVVSELKGQYLTRLAVFSEDARYFFLAVMKQGTMGTFGKF